MLDEFSSLGGVAHNVDQRLGCFGNGIFPIDPTEPILIKVPEHLLIDDKYLLLDGQDLVVSPEAGVSEEISSFHARYQKYFSWGADGRNHVETFETGLKGLSDSLISKLLHLKLLNLATRHKGEPEEVLRERFMQSRRINYHDRKVIMPIIELINHNSRSPSYEFKSGIQYHGNFTDEVTVKYSSSSDAILRFINYGFAHNEPSAFCLPTYFKSGKGLSIEIHNEYGRSEVIDGLPLPIVERQGHLIRLSHLRLGIELMPRLPRLIFRKVLSELAEDKVDEIFDRIRNANLLALCDLMELTEGVDSAICKELRKAILFQIRALSHCYGVRNDLIEKK
jgi:hypothetical protein